MSQADSRLTPDDKKYHNYSLSFYQKEASLL